MAEDNCSRVKKVIRVWAQMPADVPVSTQRVLLNLWTEFGQSFPFCTPAVEDLINRLVEEFAELKIKFKSGDFCPPESAAIRSVGNLCDAVVQSEAR